MHEYEAEFKTSNKIFHKAIKKYGKENFSWEVIDTALSKEELSQKEIDWIRQCNTYIGFDNYNGYNMTLGGEGGGYAHTEETKKLLSEMKKGIVGADHPRYGSNHTDDTKNKISKAKKGVKKTFEQKQNISKGHMGLFSNDKHPMARAVVQLTLDGEFVAEYPTAKQAKEALNASNASNITRCCKGERKTAYKFKWMYKDDYETLQQVQ